MEGITSVQVPVSNTIDEVGDIHQVYGVTGVLTRQNVNGEQRRTKGLDEEAIFDSLFKEAEEDSDEGMGELAKATRQLAQKKRKEREEQLHNTETEENSEQPQKRRRTSVEKAIQGGESDSEEYLQDGEEVAGAEWEIEDRERVYEKEFANEISSSTRPKRRKLPKRISAEEGTVQLFVERMQQAYKDDKEANKNKKPALSKLKMLPEVLNIFQKQFVRDSFFEGGVLKQCRYWLTPLPDGTLPNLKIRDGILKSLEKLDLTEDQLRASGIGIAVMILSNHKNETLPNRKICRALISKWSRPIFAISSAYTELARIDAETFEQRKKMLRRPRRSSSLGRAFDEALETQSSSQETNAPRYTIRPQKVRMDYIVRPTALPNWAPEGKKDLQDVKKELQKPAKIQEKLMALKTPKRARMRAISVGVNKPNR